MEVEHSHLFLENIDTPIGKIVVWKSANYPVNKSGLKKKKEIERLEVLQMINSLGYAIKDLQYKESGQPILSQDSKEHLSISHSHGWFALYIASAPVGVDIEIARETIAEGKDWFINPSELPNFLSKHHLQVVWGAKEAYYKKQEGQIEDLRKDVSVKKIALNSLLLEHAGHEEVLFFRQIDTVYLVWTH